MDEKDIKKIGEIIEAGIDTFKNSMNDKKDDDKTTAAAREAKEQGIINAACALSDCKVTNAKAAAAIAKYWDITPSKAKTYVENTRNIYMPTMKLKEYLIKYQDMSSKKADHWIEKNKVEAYLRKHKSAKRLTAKELYAKIADE